MSQNAFLMEEANRCLLCKNPRCSKHCPVNTSIPEVIELYKQGELKKAGEILFENNPLSAICALVCEHEKQCEGNCIRGVKGIPIPFYKMEEEISLKYLEELHFEKGAEDKDRIAVIGGGPAGITIALLMQRMGYKVTIFESRNRIGGVLRYGIPEYRLSKYIIDLLEKHLLDLGVKIRPNILIGPVLSLDKLFEDGYAAAFIGTGVWNPRTLGIKGESFGNVHFAIDYLKSPETYHLGENVAIIGAGNVAMDAARTAKRSGSRATIIYRKGMENMTASKKEIAEAEEDGVEFLLHHSPVEITDDGIILKKQEEGQPEEEVFFKADSIIVAISQNPRANIVSNTTDLDTNNLGLLLTDEKGHTTKEGTFASGDVVTGAKTVVEAVHQAKIVAEEMETYCEAKKSLKEMTKTAEESAS